MSNTIITTAAASETRAAPSRLFGDVVCVAFITAQAVDGVCSYVGLLVFGAGIEANPLIAWYIATFGAGAALIGAKLVATICGVILHCGGMHRTVGVLTILYLIGAVWPWSQLLWP
jgi:uncharacterized protein DUF5658